LAERYLPDGVLDDLTQPSQHGNRRLAGVDLQEPRLRALAETLGALAPKPDGFTLAELAQRMAPLLPEQPHYGSRQAGYDLAKLRGKQLVERIAQTRRYRIRPYGIRILAGMLVPRERVLKPVLAGQGSGRLRCETSSWRK
jgi:hypothetical protein